MIMLAEALGMMATSIGQDDLRAQGAKKAAKTLIGKASKSKN